MRVAVISDIHGNVPALRAVLADIDGENVDLVVCCGDIVAGPLSSETVEILRGMGGRLRSVRGNADREVVALYDGHGSADLPEHVRWSADELSEDQRDWLDALPETLRLEIDGLGQVLFCHGTPRRDDEIVVETTPDGHLREVLSDVTEPVVVCGNTHMQFDRNIGSHRVVNVGSVGMPYGEPGAYWAVLGDDVRLIRTDYDLEVGAEYIRRNSSWPLAERFVDENVLTVPTKQQALDYFGSRP